MLPPGAAISRPDPAVTDAFAASPMMVHVPPASAVPNPPATSRPKASEATVTGTGGGARGGGGRAGAEAPGRGAGGCGGAGGGASPVAARVVGAVAPAASVTVSVTVYEPGSA